MHSSANSWQQIFGGLTLSDTTDYLKSAKVWMVNYANHTDGIAMLSPSETGVNYHFDNYISANLTDSGVLYLDMLPQIAASNEMKSIYGELRYTYYDGQNRTWLPNTIWTEILRMPAYKILSNQHNCENYHGLKREFGMQLTDKTDQVSSIYYQTMTIETAGMIYTDDVSVITSNEVTGEVFIGANSSVLSTTTGTAITD